jgi:hypothetical protein
MKQQYESLEDKLDRWIKFVHYFRSLGCNDWSSRAFATREVFKELSPADKFNLTDAGVKSCHSK